MFTHQQRKHHLLLNTKTVSCDYWTKELFLLKATPQQTVYCHRCAFKAQGTTISHNDYIPRVAYDDVFNACLCSL